MATDMNKITELAKEAEETQRRVSELKAQVTAAEIRLGALHSQMGRLLGLINEKPKSTRRARKPNGYNRIQVLRFMQEYAPVKAKGYTSGEIVNNTDVSAASIGFTLRSMVDDKLLVLAHVDGIRHYKLTKKGEKEQV